MHYTKIKDILDLDIDLQLFAKKEESEEDEEIDDAGYTGEEDEDDPDSDDEDEDDKDPDESDDLDEDSDDDDHDDDSEDKDPDDEDDKKKPGKKPTEKVDKVTNALIEQKRLNKELQRQLKAIEDKNAEDAQQKANDQRVQQLIADGYGEAQARQIVASDSETAKLKREVQKLQFEKLEKKHPGISDHADEILDLMKKSNGVLSAEEIYNAKFRNASEYDIKTKAEAATLHKQKTAQDKKGATPAGGSDKKAVKLSPSDERAYQHLTSQRAYKSLTRAQYLKMARGGEIED